MSPEFPGWFSLPLMPRLKFRARHAAEPPPGSAELSSLPASSTATHSVDVGQAMPSTLLVPLIAAACHRPVAAAREAASGPACVTPTHSRSARRT